MAAFTTLTKRGASAASVKTAQAIVIAYREAGGGSNRSNWPRMTALLAIVLDVAYGAGVPVNVSDMFDNYHTAHRALGSALFSEHWSRVQVVALRGATWNGSTVTGESDTARGTTILICPVL